MEKISAIIITKNEEENIRECLESISFVDEIILVDSESTDNTTSIAKQFTDKIFVKKWTGFVQQKKYAVSLTTNNWILSIDADERVTKELKDEITNLDSGIINGFYIQRENYFLNKKINSCGWEKDFQLRLFRKDKVSLTPRLVHEGFLVDGKTARLKNKLIHYSYRNLFQAFEKINHYSSLQAIEKKEIKNVNSLTIISHSISAFLKFYFTLKGYKDGIYGLLISLINSITTMMTYAKIWEIQKIKTKN